MNKQKSVAFMSYVRADDEHDKGRLTEFCNLLSKEVKAQTGEEFPIFQDRSDIKWGQNWEKLIGDSLDTVTFLIPIITPSFFKAWPAVRNWNVLSKEKKTSTAMTSFFLFII